MKGEIKEEWVELLKKCKECREKRENFPKFKKIRNENCPPFPGYGHFIEDVDVMFLTQGHAGGRPEQWYERDFDKLISMKKEHYQDIEPAPSFHTLAIRNLINNVEKSGKTWYLTDIWKCFVHNDKENKKVSFQYCKNLLIKEIEILKPKIIILFGGEVQKFYGEVSKELKYKPKKIDSAFPAQWTADKWISEDWEKNLTKKIEEILNI